MTPPEAGPRTRRHPRSRRQASRAVESTDLTLIPEQEIARLRGAAVPNRARHLLVADACRLNALSSIMRAGSGHIGSSFSAMDIVLHLLSEELDTIERGWRDPERDVFFSSKGHDLPALLAVLHAIGEVPMEDLLRLRRLDGPAGHPDRRCPFMEATTGSLGMGISRAKGMALARRLTGRGGRIVVMTGDGELQEGQCWEAAQSAGHLALGNLTVVVDHNHVQSDRGVEDTMPIGAFEERFATLGWSVTRIDGHDPAVLSGAFGGTREWTGRPSLVVADTIKGRGVSFMEHPAALEANAGRYPWHSGAPSREAYETAVEEILERIRARCEPLEIVPPVEEIVPPHVHPPSRAATDANLVQAYGAALAQLGATHPELVVLDADLASDCGLDRFAARFPDRFVEVGIAEQDMVSTAGGLAHQGLLPVVNGFASFLVSRANEQIYLNACDGVRVIYACHYAGLTPAGAGATHQSLRDVSLLAAIPGVLVIQPANEEETRLALAFAVERSNESVAIRLQLGPAPVIALPPSYRFSPGRGSVLREGSDAVILAYGPVMLSEALAASTLLAERGIDLGVVHMPWLNHVDVEWLAKAAGAADAVYVLEDHAPIGALGDMIREAMNALGVTGHARTSSVETIGIEGLPAWGLAGEVLAAHGVDAASLAARIAGDLADGADTLAP